MTSAVLERSEAPPSGAPPHAREAGDVVRSLRSHAQLGLTERDAANRLAVGGANTLGEPRRPGAATLAVRQLADPLVALLAVASVVSAAIGETLEAGAIAAIVVLNAVLGFLQEMAAERAMTSLRRAMPRRATVVREGRSSEIDAEGLVPGDLVVLREGDPVPADARLVEAYGVEVDESALTGESAPVEKRVAPVAADTPVADRRPMVFAGTGVTRGRGRAVVTGTGSATELGLITRLADSAASPQTPLQAGLARLAGVLAAAGVALMLALGGAMLARGESPHEAFLTGVAVAVAAVPEGLLATVTVALALGARAMADRGAIVRQLVAIETIGATTVACVDKTGTLTENRMRVAAIKAMPGRTPADVLLAAVRASSAEIVGDDGDLRVVGDPVEAAIVLAALEHGVPVRSLRDRQPIAEESFTAERRRMSAAYELDGCRRLFTKGAPEVVLAGASDEWVRRDADVAARAWAEEGFRVLAVAERPLADGDALEEDAGLSVVGLVALHDPLRPGAADAIRAAQAAGIRVSMLTGDHPATARAIASLVDLRADDVHARVTPADKLAIVEQEQASGHVVLVTGDGVNDAPALRRADVGVAMGRGGTASAREAADIVLVDDAFETIVAAIREGRRVGDNVRHVVAFLLSANLGEVVLFAIAIVAGLGAPLAVVQVLVVNVLTDGLPALALARDPAEPSVMTRPPARREGLVRRPVVAALVAVGTLVGLAALGAYLAGRAWDPDAARTMAFATVALAELLFVFSCRSERDPAWRGARNRELVASVLASAAIVAALVYVPVFQAPFATVPLGPGSLAVVVALALVPALAAELAKASRRRAR